MKAGRRGRAAGGPEKSRVGRPERGAVPNRPSPRSAEPPAARSLPPLVLVVDDFPDNREMYVQYLSFTGYRVAEANDGEEALAKTAGLLPDVVVMDLALPRLDGWEATRRLKSDPLTRGIPVIALTGHGLPEHVERARQAGCDSFLTKPCTPIDLAAEIRRLLEESQKAAPRKGG
jgi:two-component system, cell cycle response regulator DivK